MNPKLTELIVTFAKAVKGKEIKYAVGGAIAMGAHGAKRYTQDLDVFAREEDRVNLFSALRNHGFLVSAVMRPHHYIAMLPGNEDPETRVDLMFPSGEPELSAIEQPVEMEIAGVKLNFFCVELLVASKFYSDRIEDEQDIGIMLGHGLFEPETVAALLRTIDPDGAKEFMELICVLKTKRSARKRPERR